MPGKCSFVTSIGKASISLAQTGLIPCLDAVRGKPPIPSNKLPMVNSSCSLLVMHLLHNHSTIRQYHSDAVCGYNFYRMYHLSDKFFIPLS